MSYTIHCKQYAKFISANEGATVMEAVKDELPVLSAHCSGKGLCGKCVVRILDGEVSEITGSERRFLGSEKLEAGFRLACQVKPLSDISICIPVGVDESADKSDIFTVGGTSDKNNNFAPNRIGDKSQIFALDKDFRPEPEIVGNKGKKCLGAAFDIGTTNVFAALCDLNTGEVLCTETAANSQKKFGADVVSRIEYCCREDNGTRVLQELVVSDMNRLLESMLEKTGGNPEDLTRITACGNTTMCHLLLGVKPEGLSRAPFVPAFTSSVCIKAKDLSLAANDDAILYVLPGIASFVGSDTTAVAGATKIAETNGVTIVVDIGTNGEILVAKDGMITACSTAAGPAFESGSIRGSELIGLIGRMLRGGLIGQGGVMLSREEAETKGIRKDITERLFCENGKNGERAFLVRVREDGERITLTQKDIREVQLAKAAIMAGIKTLLKALDVREDEISRVLLSGTFGSFIDPGSAVDMGLIPYFPNGEAAAIGNGAGAGAVMALLSESFRTSLDGLAAAVHHTDLSKSRDFQSLFVSEMLFKKF